MNEKLSFFALGADQKDFAKGIDFMAHASLHSIKEKPHWVFDLARNISMLSQNTLPDEKKPDYLLLALVGILVAIGLYAVFSASFAMAITEYRDVMYFLSRQVLWAVVGLIGLALSMKMPYQVWKPLSPLMLILALGTLALVLVPGIGVSQYGATRWLKLGPFVIQPSEFAKLALIIYMSAWFSERKDKLQGVSSGFLPFVAMLALVTWLVMKEPDLGTAVIIAATLITMFFLAGADPKQVGLLVAGAIVAAVFLVSSAGYRSERWLSFVDPWQDPDGRGFHIIQLLIALGSGGPWGVGLGASRQKFFYVPGAHTDGVFAIIGEEVGFIGSLAVLAIFAALVYRGIRIVSQTKEPFGILLAAGITSLIAYQTIINLGGVTQSIPLTGIPLPFISYGGSSLATTMTGVGILLNISKHRDDSPSQKAQGKR